jgi:hypothetical protein
MPELSRFYGIIIGMYYFVVISYQLLGPRTDNQLTFHGEDAELRKLHSLVAEHRQEFIIAWDEHFSQ